MKFAEAPADLYPPAIISDLEVKAAEILSQHKDENRLLYYKPCCRVHFDPEKRVMTCPVTPCPDSKHWKFHVSDKRIKIVLGGNRSSKTTTGLIEFLLMATLRVHPFRKTKNPDHGKWRIYESDFGVLEKLLIPLVKDWIPKSALAGNGVSKEEIWSNSYDDRYHFLRLKNGGMIDFMSYDQDANKSESVELDGVFADEQMPERVFTAAMSRLISRNGIFMMGVTPLYDLSWAMKFLESTDPQVEVFRFEIYDNPFIGLKEIQEFEDAIPEHEKEARIYGRFLELQGLVYKELRNDVHFLGEEEPTIDSPVLMALDPHPRKASVISWAYLTPKDDVIFFDELEMKGTAREIAGAIRSKESGHAAKTVLRLIDPAAKAQGNNLAFETDTLREFEREGLSFSLADNSEAGYNVVHEYLRFDTSSPLSSMNRPRCYFTKNVPKTWYGMTHLLWDEWNFRKALRDEKERVKDYLKDFPDNVRYILSARPTVKSFHNLRPQIMGRKLGFNENFTKHQEFRKMALGRR